jgi:hypothetical protein
MMALLSRTIRNSIGAAIFALSLAPIQQASAYVIDVYHGIGNPANIGTAITIMQGMAPTATGNANIINFTEPTGSNLGNFGGDSGFPGIAGAADFFGVHVSGLFAASGSPMDIGVNHDDGVRVFVDSVQVIDFSPPTPPRNTFVTSPLALSPGNHTVDIWLYEQQGVTSLEFFERTNGRLTLIPSSVPEPTTLLLLGLGLAGLGFARKRQH